MIIVIRMKINQIQILNIYRINIKIQEIIKILVQKYLEQIV